MTKKSQEWKKEILNNLTDWCFDPLGDLVKAKLLMNRTYQNQNHYWFRYLKDDESNPNWRTEPKTDDFILVPKDYQEIKEAMINEIKQNPQDWKIEKEGELTVVKHKSGRKHWKSQFSEGFKKGFKEEEWIEIEQILNNFQPIERPAKKQKTDNYDNLTREELITKIKQKTLDNDTLQKLVSSLKIKIQELETEISELKTQKDQATEVSEKLEIQQEIKKKEARLQEIRVIISDANHEVKDGKESNWDLKTVAVCAGVGLGISLVLWFFVKWVKGE